MKLKIHPLFFLFGLYFALCGKVFLFLTFALTAIIHEYGHAIALDKLGYRPNNISLMPYGSIINGNIEGISYKDEIFAAFCGPISNLLIAIFFISLWWIIPEIYTYTDTAVFCNLAVAAMNFLPAYPLDGGRIISATLSLYIPRKKAMKIVRIIGILLSLPLFALFIYSIVVKSVNFSILFFALFMLVGGLSKPKQNAYVRIFAKRNLKNCKIKECKKFVVQSNTILKNLIARCDGDSYFELELVFGDGRTKSLDLAKTEALISTYRLYDTLEEIAESDEVKNA